MKILIASNNKHKLSEIQEILDSSNIEDIQLVIPNEFPGYSIDVPETEDTLEGNSYLKAKAYFDLVKIPVIADDTGLETDALKGLPGVHSARFAGEHGNDALNRKKLLELLNDIPDGQRTARFRTVICFVNNDIPAYIEGICEGKIIDKEIGTNGFGYDSIFVPFGYNKTFAEMNAEEKNKISHRGKAIINFVAFLKNSK